MERPVGSNLASESRSPVPGNESGWRIRSSSEMVTIFPSSSAARRLAVGLQSSELKSVPGAATATSCLRPTQGGHNHDARSIVDVAEEGDLLAVRRPDGMELAIRRVGEPQRRRRADELDVDVRFPGFGFAIPGEGDARAIRRNGRIAFQPDVRSERDRRSGFPGLLRPAGGRWRRSARQPGLRHRPQPAAALPRPWPCRPERAGRPSPGSSAGPATRAGRPETRPRSGSGVPDPCAGPCPQSRPAPAECRPAGRKEASDPCRRWPPPGCRAVSP